MQTANFAAYLALPDTIALHERIGVANKRARLLDGRRAGHAPVHH